jgi:hypothetical protein
MKINSISMGYALGMFGIGCYGLSNLLFTLSPSQNLYAVFGALLLGLVGHIIDLARMTAQEARRTLLDRFLHAVIIIVMCVIYRILLPHKNLSDAFSYAAFTHLMGLLGWTVWIEAKTWLAKRKKRMK